MCLGKDCACEITQADIDRAARSLHGEPVRQSEQPTAAADYAKPDTPRPLCLADVKRETVDWLWRGWFPFGKISMIVGDPGLGKSNLSLDIAARLTTGKPMPFQESSCCDAADVLLLLAEDGLADTVRPRMEAAGANLQRVHAYEPDQALDLLTNIERLRADILHYGVRLVVADPLMAFFPATTDSHKDQHVRRVLSPLAALADETGALFLFVHHPNKNGGGQAVYRAGGSIGIIGAARSAVLVASDPEDPEKRILASIKGNLSKPPQSLRFRLESALDIDSDPDNAPPRVAWIGAAEEHTATTLLQTQNATAGGTGERDDAVQFLREMLAEGPVKSAEVEQAAHAAGISKRTLRRARTELNVQARVEGSLKHGGHWELYLADKEA